MEMIDRAQARTRDVHWRNSSLVRAFVSPQTSLGDLDAESAATLIATASDITLIVDAGGTIRDMAFQSEELAGDLGDTGAWLGQPLVGTVALDSRPKIEMLLRDATSNPETKWRHINHLAPDGKSVPVLYCAVQIGDEGRVVAFGRDLRAMSALQQRLMNAQQSMERDYSRLREVEMRYRLLFQTSSEAVLILDTAKLKIVEANPAARLLFGKNPDDAIGASITDILEPDSVAIVQAHLAVVRAGGRAEGARAFLAKDHTEISFGASLFREDNLTLFLVQLSPVTAPVVVPALPDAKTKLLKAVENAPDGFVVTDYEGRVLTANAAFLNMAQMASEDLVREKPLDRWLGGSGVDLDVLIANLRQRGSVHFFQTTLRGESGLLSQVEISAVSVRNGGQPSFGFAIRNVGPRLPAETRAAKELPRSVEQLTELIGRVSLKDLVREATDVIERLCIEAALELTGDNRASAAEMLGLSRQSLYVKLRRYGLGDLAAYGRN
jgi:transcriptional regulator PpsR